MPLLLLCGDDNAVVRRCSSNSRDGHPTTKRRVYDGDHGDMMLVTVERIYYDETLHALP